MAATPRRVFSAADGVVFHVMNRAVARMTLYRDAGEYEAFEQLLEMAHEREPLDLFTYCIMPNHWHLVVRPNTDKQLSSFIHWLSGTHAKRWQVGHNALGSGHVYQARFKSCPVQTDAHFLTVCRYVERNPLTAGLVNRAEEWRWGSLWHRHRVGGRAQRLLSPWPVEPPRHWRAWVNDPLTAKEERAVRLALEKGRPFGSPAWQDRVGRALGLAPVPRGPGRPCKGKY
jgi:putative transposase